MNGFATTLRWYILTNKRRIVKEFVYLFVAYFGIISIQTGIFLLYRNGVNLFSATSCAVTVSMAYILASGIFASNIANDLKTKQQRTLYFMVPASNSHKFWCRALVTAVMGFIVSAIAICLADLLNMLMSTIFSGTQASVTYAYVTHFREILSDGYFKHSIIDIPCYISMAAWGFSSFMLGGYLFRKMPFVMTCIVWFLFWSIVISGSLFIVSSMVDRCLVITSDSWLNSYNTVPVIITIAGILFTIFNLWFSYRIHKRMTVIGNRLFNL